MTASRFVLEIPPLAAYARTARLFVASAVRHLGWDDERTEDLKLAVSELMSMVAESATTRDVRIEIDTGDPPVMCVRVGSDVRISPDQAPAKVSDLRWTVIAGLFPKVEVLPGGPTQDVVVPLAAPP